MKEFYGKSRVWWQNENEINISARQAKNSSKFLDNKMQCTLEVCIAIASLKKNCCNY